MNRYDDTIRFLYGLQRLGMKFGLDGIGGLLRAIGSPHERFKTIHVAGTNGKGSVASMLAAVFAAAGYRTGLYTSPHLIDCRERIRINGFPISRVNCTRIVNELKSEIVRRRSTFFEAATAIAFQYFAENKVDIAIIETGLGGRWDATNVLSPLVAVITNLGLEHTEMLGTSLESIAREKAGIVKTRTRCVSGIQDSKAEKIVRKRCKQLEAPFISIRSMKWTVKNSSIKGITIDLQGPSLGFRNLKVSLAGNIQSQNAATALLAVEQACSVFPFRISESQIRKGLRGIQKFSGIAGRFEVIRSKPLMIADVAHNPQAMETLRRSLSDMGHRHADVVFGVMKDKDYISMIRSMRPFVKRAITVTPETGRARPGEELADVFRRYHIDAQFVGGVPAGVRRAMKAALKGRPILITGSNFVVGEAMAYLQGKKYLTINQ